MNEKNIDKVLDMVELYFSTLGFCAIGALMIFCGGVVLGHDVLGGLLPFCASAYVGWETIKFGWDEYKHRRRRHDEKFD